VAAQTRIAARNRERQRREARRARRERILLWLCAPLLLPAAGAARPWPCSSARAGTSAAGRAGLLALLTAALFGLPALVSAWLARRRGRIEPLGWAAITLLTQVALVFWVGLVLLGYGPD
jgi:hypothetical protein